MDQSFWSDQPRRPGSTFEGCKDDWCRATCTGSSSDPSSRRGDRRSKAKLRLLGHRLSWPESLHHLHDLADQSLLTWTPGAKHSSFPPPSPPNLSPWRLCPAGLSRRLKGWCKSVTNDVAMVQVKDRLERNDKSKILNTSRSQYLGSLQCRMMWMLATFMWLSPALRSFSLNKYPEEAFNQKLRVFLFHFFNILLKIRHKFWELFLSQVPFLALSFVIGLLHCCEAVGQLWARLPGSSMVGKLKFLWMWSLTTSC